MGPSKTDRKAGTLKSINNALSTLVYLSSKSDGVRLSTISRDLRLNVASMHRILATLKGRGFVEQSIETKRYYIGPSAKSLGRGTAREIDFYSRSLACLNEICERTLETANLVVRDKWEAVYVLQIQSAQALRVANRIGSRAPLYCTAAGKVLLAHMDSEELQRYFKEVPLTELTPNTLISQKRLEEELAEIVKTRIAYDRQEQALGEYCLATPVFRGHGEVFAAISLSMPSSRLTKPGVKKFPQVLIEAVNRFSEQIGISHTENLG
jgi:DNA-binding IclR family transcriptional regulator